MIISLTHEHDLDGLGSQAIIKRFYQLKNQEVQCYFAHYLDFIKKINITFTNNKPPIELIVTDIGFNADFNQLFSIFKKLDTSQYKIKWFDHHLVDDEIKKNLEGLLDIYQNDPSRCAAEIVKDYYLPNDPIAEQIAIYARDSDFKDQALQKASELQLIIEYNRGEDLNSNKLKIVQFLSEGDFENKWFDIQFESLKIWYKKETETALKNTKILDLENFGIIAISFANIGGGKITDFLYEKYPSISAAFGIDKRSNEIIIHSEKLNCREFARAFNGGGHKKRAGFKHPKIFNASGNLSSLFLNELKVKITNHKE